MSENTTYYRIYSETGQVFTATVIDDRDKFVRGFDGKTLTFNDKDVAEMVADGFALGRGLDRPARR